VFPGSAPCCIGSDYLYVILVGAPWFGAGLDAAAASVHSRKLLGSGAAVPPGGGTADATSALASYRISRLRARRVLAAAAEGAAGAPPALAPKLFVTLMQRNGSTDNATALPISGLADAVVSPKDLGLSPVAPGKYCQIKAGAASRCLMAFEGRDLEAGVYRPGEETYMVFSLEQPGQVRPGACEGASRGGGRGSSTRSWRRGSGPGKRSQRQAAMAAA
jgi:hypothetical protein